MRLTPTRLFALLTLWLAPLLLLRTAWHLAADDRTRIRDATLMLGEDHLILQLIGAVWWTWAVLAGVAACSGRPEPMRRALRALPVGLAALAGFAVLFAAAFFLAGLTIPADVVVFGLAVIVLLMVITPATAPLAVAGAVAVVTGRTGRAAFEEAFRSVRGRVIPTGVAVVVGVVAPALLAGWATGSFRPVGFWWGVLHWLATDIVFVMVAAAQAWALSYAYLEPDPAPDRAQPSKRLAAAAAGLLVLSGLLAAGAVVLHRLPEITALRYPVPHPTLTQIGWPAGRHPVLVSQQEIRDCLDERCTDVKTTALSVIMFAPSGSAAIAPDGSVFALGQDHLEHCDAQRRCRHTDGRLEILAGSAAEAIALSATGDLLIATATPVGGSRTQATEVELTVVHCADVLCAQSRATKLGVVPGRMMPAHGWRQQVIAVGLDRAGRPIVALRSAREAEVWVARCEAADCVRAGVAPLSTSDIEDLALLQFDGMLGCLHSACGPDAPVATIARPQGGAYAVVIGPRERQGLWLHAGRPADEFEAALLVCADASCAVARRIPLQSGPLGSSNLPGPLPSEIWMLAVNPDGRVLATRPRYSPREIYAVRPGSAG